MRFRLLAADCPWPFKDRLPGNTRGAEQNYRTLTIEQLERFPLPRMADDALLLFWRVSSMPEEALRVIRAWGFCPKSEIVWVKGSSARLSFGMGRYVRASHETCLVATRGSFKVDDRAVRSVFFAPRGAHSAKPDEFYRLAERLCSGPAQRAELFARRARKNWTCWGDELGAPDPGCSEGVEG